MSSRARSSTPADPPRAPAAPADSAAALEAAAILARTLTRERAAQEAAQLLRRLAGADAVVIGIAEGEEGAGLELAAQVGFSDPSAAIDALHAARSEGAFEPDGARPGRTGGDRVEIVVPLTAHGAEIGAVYAAGDTSGGADAMSLARHLDAIVPHLTTALERAAAVRRGEQRLRLDAIGEVAAGLAHELRNPLFGISSAAQLLRYRVTEDPVVEKNVGRILREVERLNTMVTALLEYGRPSPFRFEQGDPDAVWDGILEEQRGRLESKALRVSRTRTSPPVGCAIDRGHLGQALVNLFDNAIDAAPEGTDLVLSSTVLPNGAWRSRLVNAGSGLGSDVLARAFDLFYSTKPGGTGVGLPLCRRIVEEHGGTVVLESDARGTAAVVTLPRKGGAETPASGMTALR